MFKFINWALFVFSIIAAIGLIGEIGTMDAETFVGGIYVMFVIYVTSYFLFVIDKNHKKEVEALDKSIDNLLHEIRVSQMGYQQEIARLHSDKVKTPAPRRVGVLNRKRV